jgi:membrane protease YdiL (CAAX protease family)
LPNDKIEQQRSFWGPLATILWGLFIALVLVITQAIVVIAYVTTKGIVLSRQVSVAVAQLQYDGLLLSISTFSTAVVCWLAIIVVVKLKRGSRIREYLGLVLPSKRQLLVWFLIILGFVVFSDGLSVLIGKPIVPEFMSKTYASLNSPWILWMALLVAAPLSEELFFRGFLIKGLSASVLRWYGAVIVSSAAWAIVHQQYDLYGMVTIFSLGLILGVARVKTGSIILTMFLHSFCTLIAIAETLIHLRRMSA